jgi:hypothetical protein
MTAVVCQSSGGGVVTGRCSCTVLYQSRKSSTGSWCTNERIAGVTWLSHALRRQAMAMAVGLLGNSAAQRGRES